MSTVSVGDSSLEKAGLRRREGFERVLAGLYPGQVVAVRWMADTSGGDWIVDVALDGRAVEACRWALFGEMGLPVVSDFVREISARLYSTGRTRAQLAAQVDGCALTAAGPGGAVVVSVNGGDAMVVVRRAVGA